MEKEFNQELLSLVQGYHHAVRINNYERADRLWMAIEVLIGRVKS